VNGLSGRLKARIRWYGELFGKIESPVLEIKAKRGQVGSKHQFPLPGFALESGFSSDQMVQLFRDAHDLPGWVQLRIATLSVVIVNRYNRAYFVSLDGRFRVTLDSEMTTYRADNLDVRFRDRHVNRKQVVLELKYPPDCDKEADRLTSALPFRVTRSSKYIQAIDNIVVD
jgi:SPX domain protein involved in polyphosphate accumulation